MPAEPSVAAARPDVEAAERLMGGAEQQARADGGGELEEMPDIGPYVVSCLRGRGRAGENPIESPWRVLPDWIHEGRWSPLAYVSLLGLAVVLGVSASQALDQEQLAALAAAVEQAGEGGGGSWFAANGPWLLRGAGGLYGLGLTAGMLRKIGWWPLVSYTVISWLLLTLRLLSASAAHFSTTAGWISEIIRYPALLQTTVVVLVWWGVIVPLILVFKKGKERQMFWKWNQSFALVNVHLLNLPVAAADFLSAPRQISAFDVWVVFALTLLYMVFYLVVLDGRGVFLYFMFTPRTHWCFLVYLAMVAFIAALLAAWASLCAMVGGGAPVL